MNIKPILMIALFVLSASTQCYAKTKEVVEKAINASFKGAHTVDVKRLILTQSQFEKVRKRARTKLTTKIYRYYDIKQNSHTVAKAVLIARKVRSHKAVVLYVFKKNTLLFTEVLAFGDPPEYIPNVAWMSQVRNQKSTAKLTLGKDIKNVSGSTLSTRTISEGARIARAIYEIVLKK